MLARNATGRSAKIGERFDYQTQLLFPRNTCRAFRGSLHTETSPKKRPLLALTQAGQTLREHNHRPRYAGSQKVAVNNVVARHNSNVLGVRGLRLVRLAKPDGVVQNGATMCGQNEV